VIPMARSGQIITFYSYKGGTGRSMALANVACLLAGEGQARRVLMIDWDLEAPGLHEYFRTSTDREPWPADIPDESPGLIELFSELEATARQCDSSSRGEEGAREMIHNFNFDKYIISININNTENISMIKAGRFDSNYSNRVNSFDWKEFYNNSPSVFLFFSQYLCERFDFVLVDSRTGENDISGICTRLLPSILVIVFVPNRQSLSGGVEIIRRATNYRKHSEDLRPLVVFPLVSRVDDSEHQLREVWRFGDREQNVPGYQQIFEDLYKSIYDLDECNLRDYFDEVQIQYVPRFAYGEGIAVLSEVGKDRLSLSRSYADFAKRLTTMDNPWDDFAPSVHAVERASEELFSRRADAGGRWRVYEVFDRFLGSIGTSGIYGIAMGCVSYVILTALGFGGPFFGIRPELLMLSLSVIFVAILRFLASSPWNMQRKLRYLKNLQQEGYISERMYLRLITGILEWYMGLAGEPRTHGTYDARGRSEREG
jgi:eukaryotic-like serine/threonine-protein kinase